MACGRAFREIPVLKSRTSIAKKIEKETSFDDFKIPNLRENTDLDRNYFMRNSYNEIVVTLEGILKKVKEKNSNFEFQNDKVSEKRIFLFYM